MSNLPAGCPTKIRSVLTAETHVSEHPSAAELEQIRTNLMSEFSDVFNDTDLHAMRGPPMTIALTDDAVPHRVNGAHPIPFAYCDSIKKQLDVMSPTTLLNR